MRQIIELHGGSGEGQGATFTVQIPLAYEPLNRPVSRQTTEATRDLSDLHILVVDNDADSRE